MEDIIHKSFNGKEAKNSANYRESLLIVINWFIENKNKYLKNKSDASSTKYKYAMDILQSLAEIQEILYLPDNKRTTSTVLRLINITFIHAMLIKIFFNNKLLSMTNRKLFEVYYHSLIRHAPEQYRIIPGRTCNTEKEEATFSYIKKDTNNASNHHSDNVISNAFIRYQAHNFLTNNDVYNKESNNNKLYKNIIINLNNNIISFTWIKEYPWEYQYLLERQADYLVEGNIWWEETESGVEFKDRNKSNDSKLYVHHFRSSTIKEEVNHVKQCWKICLQNKHDIIPAYKIKVYDATDTTYEIITLKTLNHFQKVHISMTDNNSLNEYMPNDNTTSNESTDNITLSPSSQPVDLQNVSDIPKNTIHNVMEHTDENLQMTSNKKKSPIMVSTPIRKKSIHHTKESHNQISSCTLTTPDQSVVLAPPKENLIISLKPKKIEVDNRTPQLSKSLNMLLKIFGEEDVVYAFDKARKFLKKKSTSQTKTTYQGIVAQLEVKISIKSDELHKQLKTVEKDNVMKNSHVSALPLVEDQTNYDILLKKLQYIKVIQNQLSTEH